MSFHVFGVGSSAVPIFTTRKDVGHMFSLGLGNVKWENVCPCCRDAGMGFWNFYSTLCSICIFFAG